MSDTNVRLAVIPSGVYEWFPWWWPSTGRNVLEITRWTNKLMKV